jgi:plasmid maintenance system antidote protein VapI
MQRVEAEQAYDGAKMRQDIQSRGWLPIDLARKAKVSHMAVSRFLAGTRQTPRMAKKLSRVLGHQPDYYLVAKQGAVAQ